MERVPFRFIFARRDATLLLRQHNKVQLRKRTNKALRRYHSTKASSKRKPLELFPTQLTTSHFPVPQSPGTPRPSTVSPASTCEESTRKEDLFKKEDVVPYHLLENEKATTILQSLHDAGGFTAFHRRSLQLSPYRCLARDFIHDCLYHPTEGYFSRRARIFSTPEPIPFTQLEDAEAFREHVAQLYDQYDHQEPSSPSSLKSETRVEGEPAQVWHTPTELFKPWYGEALAKYILSEHQKQHPKDRRPLVIYEMGAGNGTLLANILDYIQLHDPQTYASMRYHIIEISKPLSERQHWTNLNVEKTRLTQAIQRHHSCVQIHHASIFDYTAVHTEPCFFLALEVIDNFAHDAVRYSLVDDPACHLKTGDPLQGHVTINPQTGQLDEYYEPVHDPLIQLYLHLRSQTPFKSPCLTEKRLRWNAFRQHFPLAENMTEPEFLPTMQLYFLLKLRHHFPRHRLILADFESLPTEVEGHGAPVVQTRQWGRMIPSSTYLVSRGWFDIFFPTHFEVLREIYTLLISEQTEFSEERTQATRAVVVSHRAFLEAYGQVEKTCTQSGENPMLDQYINMKFLLS